MENKLSDDIMIIQYIHVGIIFNNVKIKRYLIYGEDCI